MFDWSIFISASTVATIIAFVLNQCANNYQKNQKIRANCRLLFHEVNRHCYWIRQLVNNDYSPIEFIKEYPDIEWSKIKYELTGLPFNEFEMLLNHYTSMESLRALTKLVENCPTMIIPRKILLKHLETASKAHKVLYDRAKVENVAKINSEFSNNNSKENFK